MCFPGKPRVLENCFIILQLLYVVIFGLKDIFQIFFLGGISQCQYFFEDQQLNKDSAKFQIIRTTGSIFALNTWVSTLVGE